MAEDIILLGLDSKGDIIQKCITVMIIVNIIVTADSIADIINNN